MEGNGNITAVLFNLKLSGPASNDSKAKARFDYVHAKSSISYY